MRCVFLFASLCCVITTDSFLSEYSRSWPKQSLTYLSYRSSAFRCRLSFPARLLHSLTRRRAGNEKSIQSINSGRCNCVVDFPIARRADPGITRDRSDSAHSRARPTPGSFFITRRDFPSSETANVTTGICGESMTSLHICSRQRRRIGAAITLPE